MTNDLAWMLEIKKHNGLAEIPGKTHNPTLLEWLKAMGKFSQEQKAWWQDDETPWCGLAVGYVLGTTGRYVIPEWYRAKAWADASKMNRLTRPAYGAIAVLSRKGGGHVGFVGGTDKQGRVWLWGGNQGNKVCISPFAASAIESYWWPSIWNNDTKTMTKSLPAPHRYDLPLITAKGSTGISMA